MEKTGDTLDAVFQPVLESCKGLSVSYLLFTDILSCSHTLVCFCHVLVGPVSIPGIRAEPKKILINERLSEIMLKTIFKGIKVGLSNFLGEISHIEEGKNQWIYS